MRRGLFKIQGVLFTAFGGTLVVLGVLHNPVLVFLSVIFFLAGGLFLSIGYRKKTQTRRGRGRGFGARSHTGFSSSASTSSSVSGSASVSEPLRPYDTLGIEKGASEEEIDSAYRDLVKEVHPDLNDSENADEEFKRVQDAYETVKSNSNSKSGER